SIANVSATLQKSWVAGVVAFFGMHGQRKSQLHASMYRPFAVQVAIDALLVRTFTPRPGEVKCARKVRVASRPASTPVYPRDRPEPDTAACAGCRAAAHVVTALHEALRPAGRQPAVRASRARGATRRGGAAPRPRQAVRRREATAACPGGPRAAR